MIRFQDYFESDYRYAMERIQYQRVIAADTDCEVSLVVRDSYQVVSLEENELHALFSRHIRFEPAAFFELIIECNLIYDVKKGVDASALAKSQIIEALEQGDFATEVNARVSLLTSQITMTARTDPLVLPPNFIKD